MASDLGMDSGQITALKADKFTWRNWSVSVIACKLGRAVCYTRKNNQAFELRKIIN